MVLKELATAFAGVLLTGKASAGARIPTLLRSATFFVGTYTKGKSEGIYRCRLDPSSGSIAVESPVSGIVNPSYLAIDSIRGRLFSVSEISEFEGKPGGGVSAFALNPETGDLRLLNTRSTHGADPCYVSVDAAGRFVLVANYGGGSVAVLPVEKDGSLGEASDVVRHTGSSITSRQEGPHTHCITLDAHERFAYAVDLGLDKVISYRFDGREGRLFPTTSGYASLKPGAGPRHLVFAPDGASVYVVNELDSTLAVFTAKGSTGTLEHRQTISTLPSGFVGENYPADIHVSPSGRFVYCSNRGHDSIAVFAVNGRTGEITAVQHEPTRGKWPRGFAIDPSGKYLLVANQRSDLITVFSMDPESGLLSFTDHEVEVPMPTCVKFL